jgi:integrase
MFGDAMKGEYVDRNPFRGLGPEGDGRKHKRPPTLEQVMVLADSAEQHYPGEFGQQMRAMIVFMFYSMMRPGEVFAARWRHLNGDRYYVAEQWNSDLCQITEPKHDSKGEVIVAGPAIEAIRSLPRRIDDDLIFRTKRGKMFRQESFWRTWEPLRAMVGDPSLTPYDLRHAGASHMLNVLHVEPWIIGRQLRHDPADGGRLVVSLYGHPDDDVTLDRIRQAFTPDRSNKNLSATPDITPDTAPAVRF